MKRRQGGDTHVHARSGNKQHMFPDKEKEPSFQKAIFVQIIHCHQ